MEQRFIVILNFNPQSGEILKIRLTDAELAESEKYEDMESFLSTLEERYNLDLSNSVWMVTNEPSERKIGF
ncbi:MAG: hypothetical protein E7082_05445 [Bacteroidales bacterium]|nr:hypothetical protein [Bacteroidales bacterium]